MNIVLDEVQLIIKAIIPVTPEIIYEKTYVILFWTNERNIKTSVLIDETGQVVINVNTADNELIYENSSIHFLEFDDIKSSEFANALVEARDKAN